MIELTDVEKNMNEETLFLKWLVEKRIDFTELSRQYVKFLEILSDTNNTEASRYSNLLAQYLQYGNLDDKASWVRDKTVGTLYAYKRFETAPINSIWEEIIKNNNINTDLSTLDVKVYKDKE